jgi:hypothetical protein
LESSPRNTIHELGEDEFALVHGPDEGDGCPEKWDFKLKSLQVKNLPKRKQNKRL